MSDVEELTEALRIAVRECIHGESRVAMAYSGGLDSSIIDSLARETVQVSRYTCAVEGSVDQRLAEAMAETHDIAHETILLSEPAFVSLLKETASLLGTTNPVSIGYTMPLIAVMTASKERVILAGSIADELFGGYAKYLRECDPTAQMSTDLRKALQEAEVLRKAADSKGKQMGFPFAYRDVIEVASKIPMSRKIVQGERKVVLREVARCLGAPAHDRPKKAAQYSSGILKEMERLAKRDGTDIRSWVQRQTSK